MNFPLSSLFFALWLIISFGCFSPPWLDAQKTQQGTDTVPSASLRASWDDSAARTYYASPAEAPGSASAGVPGRWRPSLPAKNALGESTGTAPRRYYSGSE
eukprot:scaffold613139_cov29-Prasinocladus_malaysianus.AAC.2